MRQHKEYKNTVSSRIINIATIAVAIGIAAIIYRLIGRKIKKRGTKWWKGREVISLGGKAINSFFVIPILFNRIDEMPTHNITLHKPLKGFFDVNRK